MYENVIGYIFDQPEGRYKDKYYFQGTAEKIATFIMINHKYEVTITTKLDLLICTSMPGGLLDICTDQKFLKELLPELLAIQNGKPFETMAFKEIEPRVMKERG